TVAAPEPTPAPVRPPDRSRRRAATSIVSGAQRLVGQREMRYGEERYYPDCVGLVEAAYATVDIELVRSIPRLYDQAWEKAVFHQQPIPHPGDIVFFDDTHDRNRNGRRDDPLTHVAVVETVEEDGTIVMVHLGSKGKPVTRKRMNLLHPHKTRSDDGAVINQHLRATSDRDGGPTLASELWRGFGSFWALSPEELAVTP
ncbi:MAG: CHAP domain-containing protein, partial [Myxococcota bacterium]